jgi:TRAP-type mannitol/chloroaromatic compound transport system permease large subunit
MEVWVLFGTFVFLLLIGTPVAFCLGVASFATVLYLGLPPVVVFQRLNSGVSVFALMAIPFFIYAGELMVRGDIARRLVALAGAMVGPHAGRPRPGQHHGLGAVRRHLRLGRGGCDRHRRADDPADEGKGLRAEYAVNVTVTSSIIALMLPPSHNMIIYSIAGGGRISIADLFTAGIIPGIILPVSLMVTAWFVARKAGLSDRSFPGWAMLGAMFVNAMPGLILLIVIIFGGVRSGIFTASESSCIAVVYALLRDDRWPIAR